MTAQGHSVVGRERAVAGGIGDGCCRHNAVTPAVPDLRTDPPRWWALNPGQGLEPGAPPPTAETATQPPCLVQGLRAGEPSDSDLATSPHYKGARHGCRPGVALGEHNQ